MRKYDFISALAKETAAEVVKNREEWMKYLTTAARLYKYPFREQLLIYAQRPDATACASIELWNERMHCWVNKGAKGIELIDELPDIFGQGVEIDNSEAVQTARRAKELLDKLAEYKPLAKIEELEEQNYNMIDERLNNGVEKFNREEEKKEQQEKPQARSSLKERLAAKQKEATQGNNKDTKEQEKSKNSHREM